jgi:plastocyanin
VLSIEARDNQFSPTSLAGPAGMPFRIAFRNADAAIAHNVTIASATGQLVLNKAPFMGVASFTYDVPALAAGEFRLGCIVHPGMTATLTVR